MLPAIRAGVLAYRPVWNFRHPAITQLLKIGFPLLLYLAVADGKVFIERAIASHISIGAVSAVTYASRLFTVPSSLLAVPLAIVVYPQLAANAPAISAGTRQHDNIFHGEILRVVRILLFVFSPICLWMIVSARPVTQLLYEHGAFRADQTGITSVLLMLYCIGILPNAVAIFLLRCFYALQDTITPLVAECIDMVFYVLAVPILVRRFGLPGLAITHAICFFLTCSILVVVLQRKLGWSFFNRAFAVFGIRIAFCSAAMSIATLLLWRQLQSAFSGEGTILRAALMGAVAIFAVAIYLSLAYSTRVPELRLCFESLLRCATPSRYQAAGAKSS
jgi:putative peptidoglycan lipid II flippase